MASLMNPPGAGYGTSAADEIRRRLAGAPQRKVADGMNRIAGQNASLNKSLGITTDAAGNQVTPPPAATAAPLLPPARTDLEPNPQMTMGPQSGVGPEQPLLPAPKLAPPPQLPTTTELPQATAARPPLPPIGRGMNGERALSETPFGMGMNGTPNPIGSATQRTRRATPSAPRDPAAFIEENLANARVKLSGIGNPKGNGAIRNRGPRGARFGDTVKGGRFSGQKLEDVKSRLMGEYANQ
jgi:hypothetical protein